MQDSYFHRDFSILLLALFFVELLGDWIILNRRLPCCHCDDVNLFSALLKPTLVSRAELSMLAAPSDA